MYNIIIYMFFPHEHALECWQLRSLSKHMLFSTKKVQMKLRIYLVAKRMHLLTYHFHFFLIFSTSVHMILKCRCFRNTLSHFSTYVFVFKKVCFLQKKYLGKLFWNIHIH